MRVINEDGDDVESPDLDAGCVILTKIVRAGAAPIDDVDKFAWDDEDYEDGGIYHAWTPEEVEARSERERASREAAERERAGEDMLLAMADAIGGAL